MTVSRTTSRLYVGRWIVEPALREQAAQLALLGPMAEAANQESSVEETEQHAFLAAAGCHLAQGFLSSGPLHPERFEAWLGSSYDDLARLSV